MSSIPEILVLTSNRVWRTYSGGKLLDELDNRPNPQDTHYPEDWIASTIPALNPGDHFREFEGISTLTVHGKTWRLTDLIHEFPEEMVGKEHYRKHGANTQFLIKFLDSATRLHLQVHPTREFSENYLNSQHGKTEAYIILAIRDEIEDPFIYLGFQHPVSRKELKEIVEQQDISALLGCFDKIPIAPGDIFIVPGGLPHAIGPGVLMVEIMEPSDFVARLEFERGGYVLPETARFMGKGIDFALDMLSFKKITYREVRMKQFCMPRMHHEQEGGKEYILIDSEQTECFRVNRLVVDNSYIKNSPTFYIAIVTKGQGILEASGIELAVKSGDRVFIPCHTDRVSYKTEVFMEVVLAFPPE